MPSKIILIVMAMVIVCMMLFGNKKVRILSVLIKQLQVDISHILGNLITVIFNYQILRKPLKILSL